MKMDSEDDKICYPEQELIPLPLSVEPSMRTNTPTDQSCKVIALIPLIFKGKTL